MESKCKLKRTFFCFVSADRVEEFESSANRCLCAVWIPQIAETVRRGDEFCSHLGNTIFSVCSYAFLGTRLFPIHICMFLYESSVREFCTRVLYESSVLVRSVRWVRTGTVRRLCGDLQCGLSMRLPVRFQIFLEIEAGSSYRLANSPADLDSEYLSSLLKSV